MYYTPDNLKEIKAEERAYDTWERETKNRILSMANTQKKQKMWSALFPQVSTPDDSWMLKAKVF